MKFIKSKKALALLAGMIVAIVASVGAFAYFTAGGSGTGSASVGSSTGFTVNGDVSDALYPAGPGVTVPVTVTNNGSGAQKAGSVSLDSISIDTSSATYTGATGAQKALWDACDTSVGAAADGKAFTMADVTIGEDLAAGDTSTVHNGTLYMNDTGVSQDNCQGAPLTLNFSEHAPA
jgi:hypothetical protein